MELSGISFSTVKEKYTWWLDRQVLQTFASSNLVRSLATKSGKGGDYEMMTMQ